MNDLRNASMNAFVLVVSIVLAIMAGFILYMAFQAYQWATAHPEQMKPWYIGIGIFLTVIILLFLSLRFAHAWENWQSKRLDNHHKRAHVYALKKAVEHKANIKMTHDRSMEIIHWLPAMRPVSVHEETQPISTTHALPPPAVPTGRELLMRGVVGEALAQGYVILGMGENGKILRLMIKKLFSMLISGLPATGKTTTVFWIIGQLTLIGAKLWLVDPHMYFQDEDGNKSLAAELDALADSFVFPPCDDDPDSILTRIQWMYEQLRRRQQPGYIVRAEDTVIGIMDEFNSVADSIDPKKIIVSHKGQPLNFAKTLALIEREGRKYGLHLMLIGHKWAKQDIGGDNAVRTNATTYLCHKVNDIGQADLLLGQGQGKKVLSLTVGTYWISGSSWNAEPTKIATPMISALDLPVLLQIKKHGCVQVTNQNNVVEADPVPAFSTGTWVPMGTTQDTRLIEEEETSTDNISFLWGTSEKKDTGTFDWNPEKEPFDPLPGQSEQGTDKVPMVADEKVFTHEQEVQFVRCYASNGSIKKSLAEMHLSYGRYQKCASRLVEVKKLRKA